MSDHVRIDSDKSRNQVDIKSTTGDPWEDLGILLQGIALCMAINVDKRKLNPEHLNTYVKQEIDTICKQKQNYRIKDHNKKSPLLLLNQ